MVSISIPVSEENEKFLGHFHEPSFTPFDFVCLFVGFLKVYGIESFKINDIESYILRCKNVGLYPDLLQDITFSTNGVFKYSRPFRDSVIMAQNCDLLYSKMYEIGSTRYLCDFNPGALLSGKEEYYFSMDSFLFDCGVLDRNKDGISDQISNGRDKVTKVLEKIVDLKNNRQ